MKTIEELGVSPAPWKLNTKWKTDGRVDHLLVNDGEDDEVAKTWYAPNAQLIAAAPELYEALRGLLEIVCEDCNEWYGDTRDKCVGCPRVVVARVALAKAGGAE